MKKIAIIRGLMPRLSQAEFALSFTQFKPVFITGRADGEIKKYCKDNKLVNRDLQIKSVYGIDPLSIMTGNYTHQSWISVTGLQEACKDISILETYELFHFFSGNAAKVAKDLNIPLVCEVWTSFLHPAYFLPPYSITVKKVIKQASLFIARSLRAKAALISLGIPDEKIVVLYHGINVRRFKPKSNKSKKCNLLFVGQLERYKGAQMLLDVWPKIIASYPDTTLTLIGNGSLLNQAKMIKGVKALGYVPNDKLHNYYQQADLFLSPSINRYLGPILWWEEYFSYTLMEAQASGLPIIATNSGGIPEEVDAKNWIIPQGNKDAFYDSIMKAIRNKKTRNKLAKINRTRAEDLFDLKKQTIKLESILQKLI